MIKDTYPPVVSPGCFKAFAQLYFRTHSDYYNSIRKLAPIHFISTNIYTLKFIMIEEIIIYCCCSAYSMIDWIQHHWSKVFSRVMKYGRSLLRLIVMWYKIAIIIFKQQFVFVWLSLAHEGFGQAINHLIIWFRKYTKNHFSCT